MKIEVKETSSEKAIRESKERFLTFDQEKIIGMFGLKNDEDAMYVTFLGQEFRIDRKTAELTQNGRAADPSEMASVFELLTLSQTAPQPLGTWASVAQLCTNTTSTELTKYARALNPLDGQPEKLQKACERLGGSKENVGDVSSIFEVFPKVPVWFQYWEKDEDFPASVQILWDSSCVLHFRWSILWNVMDCIIKRLLEEAN